jgi:hypothetical protein
VSDTDDYLRELAATQRSSDLMNQLRRAEIEIRRLRIRLDIAERLAEHHLRRYEDLRAGKPEVRRGRIDGCFGSEKR